MEDTSSKNALSGYAYYLAKHKLLDEQVALQALQQAREQHTSYIEYLVKQKLLDESEVAKATAEYFGLPLCDINALDTSGLSKEFLSLQLVKKRLGLPLFKRNGLLYIAVSDPTIESLY